MRIKCLSFLPQYKLATFCFNLETSHWFFTCELYSLDIFPLKVTVRVIIFIDFLFFSHKFMTKYGVNLLILFSWRMIIIVFTHLWRGEPRRCKEASLGYCGCFCFKRLNICSLYSDKLFVDFNFCGLRKRYHLKSECKGINKRG